MRLSEKLTILGGAAKYDVSCVSSGSSRVNNGEGMGNSLKSGICHSFTADGRCVSLLKILFTNVCLYDCAYCANRRSNNHRRASFTVNEVVDLTINFYKRNYIEGLFLSSGILKSPDYTMERLVLTAKKLREEMGFQGYIHLKAIPGADPFLIRQGGLYADRLSVNIELPTEKSLTALAPDKSKKAIFSSMGALDETILENREDKTKFSHTPAYTPAGQSTQLIVGATPENDFQILSLSESLYNRFRLKRVYYSAYIPVNRDRRLPELPNPPLLREHRLYQADWLLRFYRFRAGELLDSSSAFLDPTLDPKTGWALNHMDQFPVEINRADYPTLLRTPGIGVVSAQKIIRARRERTLTFELLKKMNVVLKRARYFITCNGKYDSYMRLSPGIVRKAFQKEEEAYIQKELF